MSQDKAQSAFVAANGTEYPAYMELVRADGTRHRFNTKGPKPAKSGRMNGFYGGKLTADDGTQFQVGCNVTELS